MADNASLNQSRHNILPKVDHDRNFLAHNYSSPQLAKNKPKENTLTDVSLRKKFAAADLTQKLKNRKPTFSRADSASNGFSSKLKYNNDSPVGSPATQSSKLNKLPFSPSMRDLTYGQSFDETEEEEGEEVLIIPEDDEPDREDLSIISNVSESRKGMASGSNHASIFDDDDDDYDGNKFNDEFNGELNVSRMTKEGETDRFSEAGGISSRSSLPSSQDKSIRTPLDAHRKFMSSAKEKDTLGNLKTIGEQRALYMEVDEYGFSKEMSASVTTEVEEDHGENDHNHSHLNDESHSNQDDSSFNIKQAILSPLTKLNSFFFLSALSNGEKKPDESKPKNKKKKKEDKTLASKPVFDLIDRGLQVLFPPPEEPPVPKKPDKLKKEQLTLETVFNNGELLHADIDDGFDIDDDEFYAMLGVPQPSHSSDKDDLATVNSRSANTGVSTMGFSMQSGQSSAIQSADFINGSVADRHTGGVLQHHFYSPTIEATGDFSMSMDETDTQAEPLKLPPITAPKQSPSPFYLKALNQKTKQFISSYTSEVSPPLSVSSGTRARIRAEVDANLTHTQTSSQLPGLRGVLPSSHSLSSEGNDYGEDDLLQVEYNHGTNSYVDMEMARNQANEAKFGRYQRAYHVEDLVADNWSTFSERHLTAIEGATAGQCVPAIYIPHTDEHRNEADKPAKEKEQGNENETEVGVDDDEDDDEFKKLGLGMPVGVVLAAPGYPQIFSVMTDRNSQYPHISNTHAALPTTIRLIAEKEMKERERLQEERNNAIGSALSPVVRPISASASKSPLPESSQPSPMYEDSRQGADKGAREKLRSHLQKRWMVDKEGDLEAQRRLKDYFVKAQSEEKKILNTYLSAMDDW